MTQPIDADGVRRLSMIRLLLSRAERESRLSSPFSADSVNRMHDAVEMFLALAVQHHHGRLPRQFMDYWDELEKAIGRPLAYRAQMQRFNKLRVNLKHYGIQPHPDEIRSAVASARGLIEDECSDLLGISLEDASVAHLVPDDEVRTLLDSAEVLWAGGDGTAAFADVAEAFDRAVRNYSSRKSTGFNSILRAAEGISASKPWRSFGETDRATRELERWQDEVTKAIDKLDFRLMLIGLGVDLRRYGRFEGLTPSISYSIGGSRHVTERPGLSWDTDDFEFCRDFVIATALHLAEFDYDINYWADRQRAMSVMESAPPGMDGADDRGDDDGAS